MLLRVNSILVANERARGERSEANGEERNGTGRKGKRHGAAMRRARE